MIVAIALLLGGRNWLRAYERVAFTRREYEKRLDWYLQGRVLECDVADLSQSLMEAECYLAFSEAARSESMQRHILRLEWLWYKLTLEMTTQLHGSRGGNTIELQELKAKLTEARSMLTLPRSRD